MNHQDHRPKTSRTTSNANQCARIVPHTEGMALVAMKRLLQHYSDHKVGSMLVD